MSTPRPILIAEDDAKIAALIRDYLAASGFTADIAADGRTALARFHAAPPAAVVLDLNLPGLDGIEVCRAIRRQSAVPIIMVTARVDEIDRLTGLDTGADDYLCKPFSPKELVARVAAMIRRAEGRLVTGQAWRVDEAGMRVVWGGRNLALTPVEFRLLVTLLRGPGRVFSRAQLLDLMHDDFRDVSDRAIDSHIKNIRRKLLEAGAGDSVIAAIYGVGYRFDQPV